MSTLGNVYLLVVVATFLAAVAVRVVDRWRWGREGRHGYGESTAASCGACGYQILKGAGGRCPECGGELVEVGLRLPGTRPLVRRGLWVLLAVEVALGASMIGAMVADYQPFGWRYSARSIFYPFGEPKTVGDHRRFTVWAEGRGRFWNRTPKNVHVSSHGGWREDDFRGVMSGLAYDVEVGTLGRTEYAEPTTRPAGGVWGLPAVSFTTSARRLDEATVVEWLGRNYPQLPAERQAETAGRLASEIERVARGDFGWRDQKVSRHLDGMNVVFGVADYMRWIGWGVGFAVIGPSLAWLTWRLCDWLDRRVRRAWRGTVMAWVGA